MIVQMTRKFKFMKNDFLPLTEDSLILRSQGLLIINYFWTINLVTQKNLVRNAFCHSKQKHIKVK